MVSGYLLLFGFSVLSLLLPFGERRRSQVELYWRVPRLLFLLINPPYEPRIPRTDRGVRLA